MKFKRKKQKIKKEEVKKASFLEDAEISFVSLCKRGKNGIKPIAKADGEDKFSCTVGATSLIYKKDERSIKEGLINALVWTPNREDSEGHKATPEEIVKMAHSFMKNGSQLDFNHDEKPINKSDIYVCESGIVQKGDPRFEGVTDYQGNKVDATDSWYIVMKVESEELKKQYQEGVIDGVSMGGVARVVPEEEKDNQSLLKSILDCVKPKKQPKENDMKPEEVAEIVKSSIEAGLKPVTDRLEKLEKGDVEVETTEGEKKKVEKSFDPTDLKQVQAKIKDLKKAKLMENLDITDVKDLEELAKALEASGATVDEKEEVTTNKFDSILKGAVKAEKTKVEKSKPVPVFAHYYDDKK